MAVVCQRPPAGYTQVLASPRVHEIIAAFSYYVIVDIAPQSAHLRRESAVELVFSRPTHQYRKEVLLDLLASLKMIANVVVPDRGGVCLEVIVIICIVALPVVMLCLVYVALLNRGETISNHIIFSET